MKADLHPARPTHIADLRAFCLVMDLGSLTAAARQLSETKGSVSRRLARLERELGVTLVHRGPRSVAPTECGRIYYTHAQDALVSIDCASAAIQQSADPSGAIRLACSNGFAACVLAPLLVPLRARYPNVQLELRLTDEPPHFSTQQLDAAIFPARKLNDSSLIARKLFDWELQIVASPMYLETNGIPRVLDDLATHSVVLGAGPPRVNPRTLRMSLPGSNVSRVVALPAAVLTTNTLFAKAAALSGSALSVVPNFMVRDDISQGRLKEVFPGAKLNSRPGGLFLLYPRTNFLPAKVHALREFLLDSLA